MGPVKTRSRHVSLLDQHPMLDCNSASNNINFQIITAAGRQKEEQLPGTLEPSSVFSVPLGRVFEMRGTLHLETKGMFSSSCSYSFFLPLLSPFFLSHYSLPFCSPILPIFLFRTYPYPFNSYSPVPTHTCPNVHVLTAYDPATMDLSIAVTLGPHRSVNYYLRGKCHCQLRNFTEVCGSMILHNVRLWIHGSS